MLRLLEKIFKVKSARHKILCTDCKRGTELILFRNTFFKCKCGKETFIKAFPYSKITKREVKKIGEKLKSSNFEL